MFGLKTQSQFHKVVLQFVAVGRVLALEMDVEPKLSATEQASLLRNMWVDRDSHGLLSVLEKMNELLDKGLLSADDFAALMSTEQATKVTESQKQKKSTKKKKGWDKLRAARGGRKSGNAADMKERLVVSLSLSQSDRETDAFAEEVLLPILNKAAEVEEGVLLPILDKAAEEEMVRARTGRTPSAPPLPSNTAISNTPASQGRPVRTTAHSEQGCI